MIDSNTRIEAAVFRRLRQHLVEHRPEVQNIELMILAGFCRNCLADWYREAAAEEGVNLDKSTARDLVYGGSFAQWKALHQREASADQLAAFAGIQARNEG